MEIASHEAVIPLPPDREVRVGVLLVSRAPHANGAGGRLPVRPVRLVHAVGVHGPAPVVAPPRPERARRRTRERGRRPVGVLLRAVDEGALKVLGAAKRQLRHGGRDSYPGRHLYRELEPERRRDVRRVPLRAAGEAVGVRRPSALHARPDRRQRQGVVAVAGDVRPDRRGRIVRPVRAGIAYAVVERNEPRLDIIVYIPSRLKRTMGRKRTGRTRRRQQQRNKIVPHRLSPHLFRRRDYSTSTNVLQSLSGPK